MAILFDTHMHSSFSPDSEAPMEEMAAQAWKLGLRGICFTEHMDLDYPRQYFPDDPDAFCADPGKVLEGILQLRKSYQGKADPEAASAPLSLPEKDAGQSMWIGFGLEFGMQPHLAERFHQIACSFPLDFIIASQHLVSSLDPYYPDAWQGKNPEDMVEIYYQEMFSNLKKMREWDTLAHMDYIIRYIPDRGDTVNDTLLRHAQIIDRILGYVIDTGKCLEVNTAGYKHGLGQPNPSPSILRRYRELGGERITIGADAHAPGHIAGSFERATALLRQLGFESFCVYKNREMHTLLL